MENSTSKKAVKPFNLEAFKAGAKALTWDGREAKFVGFCEEARRPLVAYVKGSIDVESFRAGGGYSYDSIKCDKGLVSMAPVVKTVWVNLYKETEHVVSSCIYSSKSRADDEATGERIACVSFEIEE